MKKEKIYECEVRRLFIVDGKRVSKWVRRNASDVNREDQIRCHSCRGKVRLHVKQELNGPRDHVEHTSRQDSEGCPLGYHYRGLSRPSHSPVE